MIIGSKANTISYFLRCIDRRIIFPGSENIQLTVFVAIYALNAVLQLARATKLPVELLQRWCDGRIFYFYLIFKYKKPSKCNVLPPLGQANKIFVSLWSSKLKLNGSCWIGMIFGFFRWFFGDLFQTAVREGIPPSGQGAAWLGAQQCMYLLWEHW